MTLVKADLVPFKMDRVRVYVVDARSAKGGSRYLEGSRELDVIDAALGVSVDEIDQAYCSPSVDIVPSHAVTKALEPTASNGARVVTMVLGPSIDTEGTMKFSTIAVLAADS